MSEFTEHPFIKSIAGIPRWTVSDNTKRPIDIVDLIYNGRISGAIAPDDNCLCDLATLESALPDRANSTFYVCAVECRFMVLDIEAECPDDLKREFLRMPYLYGDTSMSGKGLHLCFPLPENYLDYPGAFSKPALKENNKYYELLLNHYCVFTGNMIRPAPTGNARDFNELFYRMAATAVASEKAEVDIRNERPSSLSECAQDAILSKLIERGRNYRKTPADFGNDTSRYEYCLMGSLYNSVTFITRNVRISDSDKAYFMYVAAQEILPHRAKHDEERDGLPWLLYLAKEFISKASDKSKNEGKKKS